MISLSLPHRNLRRLLAASVVLALALPHAAFAGKEPKKRVAVTGFQVKSHFYDRDWGNLGDGMAEKLVEMLIESDKFIVLERMDLRDALDEQILGKVAPSSPEQDAALTSVQAIIRGVVTNIELTDKKGAGLGIKRMRVGKQLQEVTVTVNLRIIDVVTAQVIQSKTVKGIATKKKFGFKGRSNDMAAELDSEQTLPIGEAVDEAVRLALDSLINGMERIRWQGNVVEVSGQQIIVNAGSKENVERGLRLKVFERGKDLRDPETNVVLGRRDEEIGVIEITEVEPGFSTARIVQGGGFSIGNIVRPASGVP